jgi:hypothetical protein
MPKVTMPGGDETFIVSPEEALVIARALIVANQKFREELDKISLTPDVSEFIKIAAAQQYNEVSEPTTRLHMALAEHFPALRQP